MMAKARERDEASTPLMMRTAFRPAQPGLRDLAERCGLGRCCLELLERSFDLLAARLCALRAGGGPDAEPVRDTRSLRFSAFLSPERMG
jgi:hypothetical protein